MICLFDFDDAATTAVVAAITNGLLLNFKPDAAAAAADAAADVSTTEQCRRHGHSHRRTVDYIAIVAAAADPWSLNTDDTVYTPAVHRVAKSRKVKPAIDAVLRAGSIDAQAALLRAVADHTSLYTACELARISSLKEQASHKFVCEQSA
jgi:hypothetical protein